MPGWKRDLGRRLDEARLTRWVKQAAAVRHQSSHGSLAWLVASRGEAVGDLPGISMLPRERRAPHILGLRFAGGLPAGMLDRLAGRGVHVADRMGVMRVSPHVYNHEGDVAAFAAALKAERAS